MIEAALVELGHDPARCRTRPVHGGDIHSAWFVEPPASPPIFIKANRRPLERIFELEAAGLEALRAATEQDEGLLRVPRVEGFGAHFLALEWIESGSGSGDVGARFGRGLAALHRHSDHWFGWSDDNWIGSLPQYNGQTDAGRGGAHFFAERRLRPQARLGEARLGAALLGRIDRFCERVDELLGLPSEMPALVHGDLWGGNWIEGAGGVPWIYDPAVHYGCREAELAFTRLFGGFPGSFYDAYEARFPLEPGFDERVDLWNLYPLLVHANLFGGGYASRVDRILQRHLG